MQQQQESRHSSNTHCIRNEFHSDSLSGMQSALLCSAVSRRGSIPAFFSPYRSFSVLWSARCADMRQGTLQELWHAAPPGRLSPWQQAFAMGLREASKEIYGGHVCVTWIASKLRTVNAAGDGYSRQSPSPSAVSQLFDRVGALEGWFPRKVVGAKRGAKPALTEAKRARIASSAMSQKAEGQEPSAAVTVHRCLAATLNPHTQKPFSDKVIRGVFCKDCFDFVAAHPWKLQMPLQKVFLPADVKAHRLAMCRQILEAEAHGSDAAWWSRNVVWIDPCASILPRSQRQYEKMRRAQLGNKKRFISDDARMYSRNLRAPPQATKQCG